MCRCFFFKDTATTEIYTLSLHDALPISADGLTARATSRSVSGTRSGSRWWRTPRLSADPGGAVGRYWRAGPPDQQQHRSEEHTSELQSRQYLVCRLLLEKKIKL